MGGRLGEGYGGYTASVEVFPPAQDTCFIPDLPRPRADHSISLLPGGKLVVCGGRGEEGIGGVNVYDSCIAWEEGNVSWSHLHTTRYSFKCHISYNTKIYRSHRYDHTAWVPIDAPDTILLMGGAVAPGAVSRSVEKLPGICSHAILAIWAGSLLTEEFA